MFSLENQEFLCYNSKNVLKRGKIMLFYTVRFLTHPKFLFAHDIVTQKYSNKLYADENQLEISYIVEDDIIITAPNGKANVFPKDTLLCILTDMVGTASSSTGRSHHVTFGLDVKYEYTLHDSSVMERGEIENLIAQTRTSPAFLIPHPSWAGAHYESIKPMIEKLTHNYMRSKAGNYVKCLSYAYNILSEITFKVSQQLAQPDSRDSITEIISYIDNNFTSKISLDDISETLGISKGHLCRIFKKHKNTTVAEYVIGKRMELAANLAAEKTMTAAEISSAVGVDDQYYFSKLFLRYHGVNFSTYRASLSSRS